MDTQIPGDLRDRPTRLDHHLHRLSLELRAETSTLLGHEQILSVESHCRKTLIHLRVRYVSVKASVEYGCEALEERAGCGEDEVAVVARDKVEAALRVRGGDVVLFGE